jgi:hypothetical protein
LVRTNDVCNAFLVLINTIIRAMSGVVLEYAN